MPYSVQKENSDIITVCFTGSVELPERKMCVDEVCELVSPSNAVKLLIDVTNITMNMSVEEQAIFGEYLAGKDELNNAKVAVLHNRQNNPNLIINAIAYSKGYATVDFDFKADAISWLNGEFK